MSNSEDIAGLLLALRGEVTQEERTRLIDHLAAKIAFLEKQFAAIEPTGERCPYCGYRTLMLERQERCKIAGDLGAFDFHWKCSNPACARTHVSNDTHARP